MTAQAPVEYIWVLHPAGKYERVYPVSKEADVAATAYADASARQRTGSQLPFQVRKFVREHFRLTRLLRKSDLEV
jgi:hypothetical protein